MPQPNLFVPITEKSRRSKTPGPIPHRRVTQVSACRADSASPVPRHNHTEEDLNKLLNDAWPTQGNNNRPSRLRSIKLLPQFKKSIIYNDALKPHLLQENPNPNSFHLYAFVETSTHIIAHRIDEDFNSRHKTTAQFLKLNEQLIINAGELLIQTSEDSTPYIVAWSNKTGTYSKKIENTYQNSKINMKSFIDYRTWEALFCAPGTLKSLFAFKDGLQTLKAAKEISKIDLNDLEVEHREKAQQLLAVFGPAYQEKCLETNITPDAPSSSCCTII